MIICRVDFKLHPEAAKADGVTRPPHVIMISGTEKAFEFQGLWSQAQVELKVDEILRGLKRVGKDWRPVVPGMTPAAGKRQRLRATPAVSSDVESGGFPRSKSGRWYGDPQTGSRSVLIDIMGAR